MAGHQERLGIWFDDDTDFLRLVAEYFSTIPDVQIVTRCTPYAADYEVRRHKPDFVVFDLRWKSTPGNRWYECATEGLDLIRQVKALFGGAHGVPMAVVSDLVDEYASELAALDCAKLKFRKQPFRKNVGPLCDAIIGLVRDIDDDKRDAKNKYLNWCNVFADLPLNAIDLLQKHSAIENLNDCWPSPALWRTSLEEALSLALKNCRESLEHWDVQDEKGQREILAAVVEVEHRSRAKTFGHGLSVYELFHGMRNALLLEERPLSETEVDGAATVLSYCARAEAWSPVEQGFLRDVRMRFREPEKRYVARIKDVTGREVVLVILDLGPRPLEARMARALFPKRDLIPGMHVVLEAHDDNGRTIVVPNVLSPSTVPLSAKALVALRDICGDVHE